MTYASSDDRTEWPSFAEELGRKSLEQLEKWMKAHEAGRISKRELYVAVSTIYDCGSGLAPKEVSDLLADVHKELRNGVR